ncbi:Beta-galactosidase C-terminal domain [Paenibacillus thalictri]|uniref:Beta-galactosidase C-terminal domain-containing protein n=1 Tax=Paenibacillus thalictri TaxID=2527873 RepID=A0A4Q9DI30_9BACL|nr:hypothetical protein EYB31_28100 [Paenibacillus thalictri]
MSARRFSAVRGQLRFLKGQYTDLIAGATYDGEAELAPNGVVILQRID